MVLPILGYAGEVWAVDTEVGKSAERLHRQFLKHVLGVRGSTATPVVLTEFGRYTSGSKFFDTTTASTIRLMMNASCLIQCAFVEGLHNQAYAYCFSSHRVQTWILLQSTALHIEDEICVSMVIDNAKNFIDRLCTWLIILLLVRSGQSNWIGLK